MNSLSIFGIQFALSLFIFVLLAKWYAAPWLRKKSGEAALAILLLPHTVRHIGLSFLVPGLTDSPPEAFATSAAYGDLTAGLLAILSLVALRRNWGLTLPLIWLFNLLGSVDLVNALRQAEAVPHLGVTWFIPTFLVPVLLVSHGMIFQRLFQNVRRKSDFPSESSDHQLQDASSQPSEISTPS